MQVNTPEVHQNERFLARPSRNPDVSKASRRALLSGTPGSMVEFPKKQENSSLDLRSVLPIHPTAFISYS
jgi:hypothetical protein